MPGNSVGQIALELTLNRQGFESDMTSVLGTAKSAGSSLAKIFQNSSRAASTSVTKAIGGVTNQLSNMARKAVGLVAAAFSVREIVSFSKACIELGSDLTEVQNVVDVTFGSSAKTINEFAKNAAESFGLSELSAKQYSSTIGAMFKSMGIAGDQVTEMSQKMAELAGDMASFYNLDSDEAFSKIRSGIAGVTMPLQQLGISLSQANLEAYALANGFGKAYNQMSQAEQAIVRYNYLLHVTSDAQGDFARTSQSWANQIRILQLRFEQLKATIGQGLINALTPIVRVINLILAKLQRLAEAFRNFTAYIFGNAGGSVSSTTASIADSLGNASTGASGLADGMKDTADAAKTALRYLAPFDELNVLNTNPSSGGSGSGAVDDLAGLLEDAGTTFGDGMSDLMDSIEIKPTAFTDAVKRAIEKGDWYGVGALFAEKLNAQVQKWDAYGDGFKLGEKIRHALEAINGFLENFSFYDLGDKVAQWFIGLFNGITAEEVIQFFRNVLTAIKDFVKGFIDRMIKEWQARTGRSFDEFGQWVAEKLNEWIKNWKSYEDGFNLGKKIKKALTQLNEFLKTFDFVDLGAKIGDWLAGMVDGITPETMAETLANAINGAIGLGVGLTTKLKEKNVPEKIGKAIGAAFAGINWSDAATVASNIITGLAKMLSSSLTSFVANGGPQKIETALGNFGAEIGKAFADFDWKSAGEVISSIVNGIIKMFTEAVETFISEGGFQSLWEGIKELPLALPLALTITKITTNLTLALLKVALMKAIMGGGSVLLSGLAAAGVALGAAALTTAAIAIPVYLIAEWMWNGNGEGATDPITGNRFVKNADGTYSVLPPDVADRGNGGVVSQEEQNKTLDELNEKFNTLIESTAPGLKRTLFDIEENTGVLGNKVRKEEEKTPAWFGGTGFDVLGIGSNVMNSVSVPLELDLSKVVEAADRSDLPSRIEQLANKSGSAMKRGLDATNIPGKFLETALSSVTEFGKGDYNGSGKKAGDGIKTGAHNTNIPGKFNELATLSLNEFTKRDFSSGGRNAGDTIKSGFSASNVQGAVAAVAQSAVNAFKSVNWASTGSTAGANLGSSFKSAFVGHAKATLMLQTAAGKPITQAYVVPYANGGFVQGGLFLAGEVPGEAEMVGDINGKTGVASGQEITGIGDAVRQSSDEEQRLLRQLVQVGQALLAKDPFGSPNSAAGRWIAQSSQAYKAVTG